MNRDLSQTVFGGKQNYEFWQTIFESGKSPQGQQVLAGPINLMEMIQHSARRGLRQLGLPPAGAGDVSAGAALGTAG